MATEVVKPEYITLEDGTKLEIKPLVISRLRKFMRVWDEWVSKIRENETNDKANEDNADTEGYKKKKVFTSAEMQDKQYDVFVDLLVISLENKLRGEMDENGFKEYLEDNVNQPNTYTILKVCGDLDLDPENLTQALSQMQQEPTGEQWEDLP